MPVSLGITGVSGALVAPASTQPVIIDAAPIGNDEYEELDDSPQIEMDDKGISVRRSLITDWDNALPLAAKLKGSSQKVGDQWQIRLPATFPRVGNSYVKKVSIKPFTNKPFPDGSTLYARYEKALLSVDYDTPDSTENQSQSGQDNVETYVTEDIEPHAQFLTLGNNFIFWKGGTQIQDVEAPGKCLRSFAWVYTRNKMAEIPAFMFDFMGTVNSTEITSKTLKFTFAAETLLFDEPRLTRDITSQGVQAWKVTMRFIYQPWTWNKFFRAGRKDPEFLYTIKADQFNADGTLKNAHSFSTLALEYLEIYKPYDLNDFRKITG